MQQRAPENYDPNDLLINDETIDHIAREAAERSARKSSSVVPLPVQKENTAAAANSTVPTPTSTPPTNDVSASSTAVFVEDDSKRQERLRKAKLKRQEFESRVKRKRTDESELPVEPVPRRESAPAMATIKSEANDEGVLCEDEEFFNMVTMSQMQPAAKSGSSGGRVTPKRSKMQLGGSRSPPKPKSAR